MRTKHDSLFTHALYDYASSPKKLLFTCPHYSPLKMGRRRDKVKTRPNKHATYNQQS